MIKRVLQHFFKQKNVILLLILSIIVFFISIISAYLPLVIGNIRKYSINEYWNKGNLSSIWSTKIVQYLASKIKCIDDMELITNSIAEINTDDCIYLDAIEDDLNDLDLIKDIVNILQ